MKPGGRDLKEAVFTNSVSTTDVPVIKDIATILIEFRR
jgi:hypothetical protein